MIKEKKVFISINIRNCTKFRNLGYDFYLDPKTKSKTEIEANIEDISKKSRIRITAICDICNKEVNISISKYWANYERGGYNFYSCFGCKNVKKEKTNMITYGVKSFSETDEFKEKSKKTWILNYGVDNPNKSLKVRNKIRETNMSRYGMSCPLQSEDIIESNRKWMSSDEFKEKSKKTMIEKWGVDIYSKTDGFKEIIRIKKVEIIRKIKETFLSKYGIDWFSKSKELFSGPYKLKYDSIRESSKLTCMLKYGVDNVSKVEWVIKKSQETKINLGLVVHPSKLSKWEIYRRSVSNLTRKNKKRLFEEWNGCDYYDNETIIGYLDLPHYHRYYPTIDHRISVLFGFNSNISVDEIGSLSNLCITKRYINCMKSSLIEEDFILKS